MQKYILSEEEMKSLDTWINISNIVSQIYDELIDVELNHGMYSSEYKTLVDRLSLSLDAEYITSAYWLSNYERLNSAREYISSRGNSRILTRISNDYDARMLSIMHIRDKYFSNDCKNRDGSFIKKVSSLYKAIVEKQEFGTMEKVIFSFIKNKEYISLLDLEIEKATSEKEKRQLLVEKSFIIRNSKYCEDMYFNFGRYSELLAYTDDYFASSILNTGYDDYIERKNANFLREAEEVTKFLTFPDNQDTIGDSSLLLEINLRSILHLLDIESLHKLSNKFAGEEDTSKSFGFSCIENAFSHLSNDCKVKMMRLAKIPNN